MFRKTSGELYTVQTSIIDSRKIYIRSVRKCIYRETFQLKSIYPSFPP